MNKYAEAVESSAPPSYDEVQGGHQGFVVPPQHMPMPMPMQMNHDQNMPPHHYEQPPYPMQPQQQQQQPQYHVPYPSPYPGSAPAPAVQVQAPYNYTAVPTTTHTTVIVNPTQNYGSRPQHVICPNCLKSVQTEVRTEISAMTHMLAAALCILGCFICSCLPYCIAACQNKNHFCPSCKAYLGTYPQRRI